MVPQKKGKVPVSFLNGKNSYIPASGRYIGVEIVDDDGVSPDEQWKYLAAIPGERFAELVRLEKVIRENLRGIGYGI